ncbi:SphA family protein [Halomonas sp. 328]|uniref:SphA family protein n=1 Tax=Halomonas sp. 328 TaxID=2776704 RepID=UPI0018A77E8F|nr:transporter [Halomonas sp. 328]MBF8221986.1 transporter [Halomonas sp. 328]
MKGTALRGGIAGLALLAAASAQATEGGGSSYPMGAENFLMGALPSPGVYPLLYANHYAADAFRDGQGNRLPIDFRLRANVLAPRLLWVTEQTLWGGQLAFAGLFPLVDLDVTVNGQHDSARGLGDIDLTMALAYHHSPHLHSAVGVDLFVPTGSFDAGRLANLGRNYWTVQGVYALSRVDPEGLNWDLKVMYDYNFENSDTHYQSGQELHADYALGYALRPNWVAGVGGYAYRQVTDDRLNGVEIGNRGRAFAIGPSLKWDNGQGAFVTLKYEREFAVQNRPQGDSLWLKASLPF